MMPAFFHFQKLPSKSPALLLDLSSMTTISLLMILRKAFVRMEAFTSALLSMNALSQSKPAMAFEITAAFACL